MSRARNYERKPDGQRLDFHGVNTTLPPDRLPDGKYPYAQNIRRYTKEQIISRAMQDDPLFTLAAPVQSLRRLNDTTPAGPVDGFIVVSTAGTVLYANNSAVKTGLSGKRTSLVPFRPNASVQPWMYVADDNLMLKVRSDGTCYLDGIEEPQDEPTVVFPGGGSGVEPIQYRYVYRSSATGALSNPSPPSAPGTNAGGNQSNSDTLPTDQSFNPSQWSFVSSQLRTTGSATSAPQLLDYVIALNFGFTIPEGSRITGIQVDLNWQSQSATNAQLQNVAIFYRGNIIGVIKHPGTAPDTSATDAISGDAADLWGTTFTPDIVNDPTFGFGIQIAVQTVRLFLNGFTVTVFYSTQDAEITATASSDPQVDLIDYYRFGAGLDNYTYVGTGPNPPSGAFEDEVSDIAAELNPVLQFDNFQPFPSIDLPRAGVVDVSAGVVSWVSGDTFNLRWLPGTIMVIGGVAYTLLKRPLDIHTIEVDQSLQSIPDQTGSAYTIQEPDLAAQPMRSMWGPTDNVAFMFACGDPLRPGTLYFTKGNNPDSAPDTNQIEVTSPSEPLQNGCIVNGISLVMSTERGWLAYPNFFNALATVSGTVGSPFTMVLSISNRGLFARAGIATDGGATGFFIGKDGIYRSPGGQGSISITDEDLYNIFPHEEFQETGQIPDDIVIAGHTIYAPDFTNPDAMALSYANGFLYFDYADRNGDPRTLVYDDFAKGWVIDVYEFPAVSHENAEGPVDGVYVGCDDNTIRQLIKSGTEDETSIILTAAFDAGDTRAVKSFGDLYLEAAVQNGNPIAVAVYYNKFQSTTTISPNTLAYINGKRNPYILDFAFGNGFSAVDVEVDLEWNLDPETGLYIWQPSVISEPEYFHNRPTDWDDGGYMGAKFVQGVIIEGDTGGTPKTFRVQSDDGNFYTVDGMPVSFNSTQETKPFTFTPPFVAHQMRIVSTDAVPFRIFEAKWVFQPYPELTKQWQTEGMSHLLKGWQHIRLLNIAHISTVDLLLTLTFDHWPQIQVPVPNSGGLFVKTKVTIPVNKFKIVDYRLSSTAAFRVFERDIEVYVKEWGSQGPYQILKPFGGDSNMGAKI